MFITRVSYLFHCEVSWECHLAPPWPSCPPSLSFSDARGPTVPCPSDGSEGPAGRVGDAGTLGFAPAEVVEIPPVFEGIPIIWERFLLKWCGFQWFFQWVFQWVFLWFSPLPQVPGPMHDSSTVPDSPWSWGSWRLAADAPRWPTPCVTNRDSTPTESPKLGHIPFFNMV